MLIRPLVCLLAFACLPSMADDLKDPTRPNGASKALPSRPMVSEQGLNLSAIMRRGELMQAVLNGKLLSLGDSIDSWVLVDITAQFVTVENAQQKQQILRLDRGIDIKRVSN